MGEPCNQLLALAVFVDSLKTAYVRSIHVHEEKVGSIYTVQQDFLLNPGGYTSLSQPVMSGSFRTFMSSAGVKQIMGAILKMHENDGWHCVLAYRNDSPSETTLPYLLTPSRNRELKNIPSLEQDLKLVEYAVSKQNGLMCIDDEGIVNNRSYGEGKIIHKENWGWLSSNLLLSCPSDLTLSDHSNDQIPSLETPERTPRGQQLDIWHNWGSELELASPRVSYHRTSHSHHATPINSSSPMSSQDTAYHGAHWNPSTLLDLNLDLTELPSSQDNNVDCALLLSNPVSEPMSCLSLELRTPALSLQQSTITEDSMDCFTLECFGDSPSSYDNTAEDPHTKLAKVNVMQKVKSMCSEDSVDCHGSVINTSSSEVNGNSSMTSTAIYSASYQRKFGCVHGNVMEVNGNSSMTSSDVYSAAHKKNAGCINECVMNVSSSAEMNGNSFMTSSNIYSAPYYKKNAGCIRGSIINVSTLDVNEKSSSDMYSGVKNKYSVCIDGEQTFKDSSTNHSWREEGRENSRRTCSSGSRQSVQQLTSNVNTENKPRIVRSGSTSERTTDITLQELSQYFCMPITQASKELKVGLTVLKKRCREFGIPRWPHRKIKSVHSLISNIQDLAEDQGVKSSPRVQNVVKELEEQKKLMVKMPGVQLAERTKKLRQACFKANYKKRRLGMIIGNAPCVPPSAVLLPLTLPSMATHSFSMMDLNPTLIIPSPPNNHHTMDHFL